MKQWMAAALTAWLMAALTGCGAQPSASGPAAPVQTAEAAEPAGTGGAQKQEGHKVLIAYFTWAENTHVDDPSSVDPDASTSASVLPPGNTAKLAGWIQERTGGDLFSIRVKEPYSSNYDECLDRAAEEKQSGARPELTDYVAHMDDYDVIFLGYPNWWYTLPMPVMTFLESYDFSGKTVIPFCAHGTGGLAESVDDLRAALPASATVGRPIGVYRPDVDSAEPRIDEWLESAGW